MLLMFRNMWYTYMECINQEQVPSLSLNTTPHLDSLPYKMSASVFPPHPGVSVPHDILTWPQEECIELANAAIRESGTNANGGPCYSVRQAEKHFGVPRTTLGRRLKGM